MSPEPKKYGWNWDYIRNDYPTALAIAKNLQSDLVNYSKYCASYPGYSQIICADDTYYNGYGLRKDLLVGANAEYKFNDTISIKLTPYYHRNRGIGTWWTPYTPTPGGAALSIRSTAYAINRGGATGGVTLHLGDHQIEVGGWFERNGYTMTREFFPLANSNVSSIDNRQWPQNPFYIQYQYDMSITTAQYFVQDTWQMTPDFKVTAGFKGLDVKIVNKYDPISQSSAAARDTSGTLESKKMFLPQVGLNYAFSGAVEAFAGYAENMRSYTTEPFVTNQAGWQYIENRIKPETSWTAEGGLRFHFQDFEGSIAAYHVKFSNRLLSIQSCPIVVGCASTLSNVGSVTTNGAELAGTYHITRALSLYGSYAYTDAKYDDDVILNGDPTNPANIQHTRDKTVVSIPKHLANGEISYDDGSIIARIAANYQSRRYYTYTNDASVPGRVLVDFALGYRFHDAGSVFDGLEIQGNITNVFDKKYVATLGENGFAFSDPSGSLQSMLVGAPRQAFVTLRKRF